MEEKKDSTESQMPLKGEKPMRTYAGDVAYALAHQKASTASIAIAESRKREQKDSLGTRESSHAGKKLLIALLSLMLIGAGVSGAYYLYTISPLAPVPQPPQQAPTVSSLIPSDTKVYIPIDGLTSATILTRIKAESDKPQAQGTIKEVVLTKTQGEQTAQVRASDMVSIMDIGAPDILVRTLAPQWMLGIYSQNDRNVAFVVVKTDFFQNAFAGMLQWESVMADDIRQYLYPSGVYGIANTPAQSPAVPTATTSASFDPLYNIDAILPSASSSTGASSTTSGPSGSADSSSSRSRVVSQTSSMATTSVSAIATSTDPIEPTITPYPTIRGQFVDRIIDNKDVREFKATDGRVLFLYSFIDDSRLVVAPTETVLAEILARLEKQAFVR